MEFTNILNFEHRMQSENVTVAFFQIQYHKCMLECAYSSAQRKFLLAFVDHNIGFTCSLRGIYANGFINHEEAVKQLMICRQHGKYDPIDFYDFLNNRLPAVRFSQISQEEYVKTVSKSVSDFEDRIYFNHWRSANISERQKNKAIELMGYNVVKFCSENRLTPVFFSMPSERTLASFENFQSDFDNFGLNQ
jgi:hypothetical protein